MASVQKKTYAGMKTEIPNLGKLRDELAALAPGLEKELAKVNKGIASTVATKAKSNFYSTVSAVGGTVGAGPGGAGRKSGPGSVGRSKKSIRAGGTQKESKVIAGGGGALGFFGHEFGGGKTPRTRQFAPHKGTTGYAMYPAIRAEMKNAHKLFDEAFDRQFPPDRDYN